MGLSENVLLPKYDPFDPAMMEDPYPLYAQLRAAGRLCRGGPGQWVATHHPDVVELLRDRRLGNCFPESHRHFAVGYGTLQSFFKRIVLNQDAPEHTRLRRLLGEAFLPPMVDRLHERIAALVDELLTPALNGDDFDAVRDLAMPLPILVICELIGIPRSDVERICPRAADLGKAFGTQIPHQDRVDAAAAIDWFRDYIETLLVERRGESGGDLLSSLGSSIDENRGVAREEFIDNIVFLFFAGFETTKDLISTGCAALLEFPAQMELLRSAPGSLAPHAVEEFLRYDAPIQSVSRLILEPIEIGNYTLRKGRVLTLLLGSANHDPQQFLNPQRPDITRRPNPHVSFGGGVHHCLGAALARMEGRITFQRIAERLTHWQAAGPALRKLSAGFRGYSSVPVRVRAA